MRTGKFFLCVLTRILLPTLGRGEWEFAEQIAQPPYGPKNSTFFTMIGTQLRSLFFSLSLADSGTPRKRESYKQVFTCHEFSDNNVPTPCIMYALPMVTSGYRKVTFCLKAPIMEA